MRPLLFVALAALVALPAAAQTARAQVVHHAADPALANVYLGEELVFDDLAFKSATRFVGVAADGPTAGLAAGVYVLRLETAEGAHTRTVTVVR